MSHKEIELKIKISGKQLAMLTKWLKRNAKFDDEEHQIDYYFDHPELKLTYKSKGKDGKNFKDARDYFRVRIENGESSTCLKHFHDDPERPGSYTHCDEFETEIEDAKTLIKLYQALGFIESCIVDKIRKTYKYKHFEIEIDNVKDLGVFVELELKTDVDDPKKGRKMIRDLLKEIGINKYILTNRGYVSMLWNPGMDFGEEIVK